MHDKSVLNSVGLTQQSNTVKKCCYKQPSWWKINLGLGLLTQQQGIMGEHPPTFSVFVGELKGLDETQGLLHRAAHRQVVDGDLTEDAFTVDDEQPSVKQQQQQEIREEYDLVETSGKLDWSIDELPATKDTLSICWITFPYLFYFTILWKTEEASKYLYFFGNKQQVFCIISLTNNPKKRNSNWQSIISPWS